MNRTAVVAFCGFFSLLFAVSHVLLAEQGGGNRRGAGSSCTYNWIASAKHIYFNTDSDWATNTIPDDECTTSCTAQALGQSTNINESDLSTTGLPSGTASGRVMLPLNASGDAAFTTARIFQAADHGDWAFCMWARATNSVFDDFGGHEFVNNSIFAYGDVPNGSVGLYTTNESSGDLTTGTGKIAQNTWAHICWTVDNNGSLGGTDVRRIIVNGVQEATDNSVDDTLTAGTDSGFRNTTSTSIQYEVHEGVFLHQAITANNACQIMSCGVDDSATFATRRSTYGACTL